MNKVWLFLPAKTSMSESRRSIGREGKSDSFAVNYKQLRKRGGGEESARKRGRKRGRKRERKRAIERKRINVDAKRKEYNRWLR